MKRAAIIGLGTISSIHLMAIDQNPNITLAAVCDIDEAKRGTVPGVPFYTDYQQMIEQEKPDVVHICLPHALHVPVSLGAARLGCHVFCEKPVALNAAQAAEFAAFEAAHPELHLGLCLQNRCNESVEALKKIIDSGQRGKVLNTKGIVPWARPASYYAEAPWRGQWATAGGGCMINQAVHTLDLLYYLGGPVGSVKAAVTQLLDYGIEVEDTVCARLAYAGGAHGLFLATIASYKNENPQISVCLEQGEYAIENCTLYELLPDGTRRFICEDAKLPGSKFYYGASHGKLIGKFYAALEAGTQDYIHVRDAVMSIRLIDAIQKAGKTGAAEAV